MAYPELQIISPSGGPPVSIADYRFDEDISGELKGWERGGELSFTNIRADVTDSLAEPLSEVVSAVPKTHQEIGPIPMTLEIESKDGLRFTLQYLLFRMVVLETGETVFSNEFEQQNLHIIAIAEPDNKKLLLRSKLDYGGLTVEQASYLTEFFNALSSGGDFRLFTSINKEGQSEILQVLHGYVEPGRYEGPDTRLTKTLDRLTLIQEKTANFFIIPEDGISPEDYKNIRAVADIVQGGHATYGVESWITVSTQEQARAALATYEKGEPVPVAAYYEGQSVKILGTWVSLGPVLFGVDKTYMTPEDLDNLNRQVVQGTQIVKVRITPFNGCLAEARYLNWLPEGEVNTLRKLPIFSQVQEDYPPIDVEAAIALLQSWHNESPEKQRISLDMLDEIVQEGRYLKPLAEHE
jgi:hypothetical protein